MDNYVRITQLNDFVFCPMSIYFHNTYGNIERQLYQEKAQVAGSLAHQSIDEQSYSSRKEILTAIDVISTHYRLIGKIDIYDGKKLELIERKKRIKTIYDGYIFQLYGQYFAMRELGYEVKFLSLYSLDDNKKYDVSLPEANSEYLQKFEETIKQLQEFNPHNFRQNNSFKCQHCIYEPSCDRSVQND